MDNHEQAKILLKHAYNGDVTAFKKEYQTFQKERIVTKVQDVKQDIINDIRGKLETADSQK